MKKLVSFILAFSLIVSLCACSGLPADQSAASPEPAAVPEATEAPSEAPATYYPAGPQIHGCAMSFETPEELIDDVELVLAARVTGMHYEYRDDFTGEVLEPGADDGCIRTYYDIEPLLSLKGGAEGLAQFWIYGAKPYENVEAQAAAWGISDPDLIPVFVGTWPEINVGGIYLLCLHERAAASPTASTWQNVFPFEPNDPAAVHDKLCMKDIVMQFGEGAWEAYTALKP